MKYLKKSCNKRLNILNILINNNSQYSSWDIYNSNIKTRLEFSKTSYLKNNKTNIKYRLNNSHCTCSNKWNFESQRNKKKIPKLKIYYKNLFHLQIYLLKQILYRTTRNLSYFIRFYKILISFIIEIILRTKTNRNNSL